MPVATSLILFACWWLPVLLLALALRASRQTTLDWRWFGFAALAYALYSLAGYWTLPEGVGQMPAEARWYSRSAQLATGAALIALAWGRHPLLTRQGLGLVARQAPGTLVWSIGGIALLALIGTLPGGFDPAAADPPQGAFGWVYHLTLPGIEEEVMYRGLLLSALAVALGGTGKALAWAAVMSTIVFALAHGIFPNGAGIGFNPLLLALTAVAGTILAIMRLKSGSLLAPMVGHNFIGLTGRLA
ncbi:CPBP family glutamic-type intramembrane protease [Tsuneonella sp. HG222]